MKTKTLLAAALFWIGASQLAHAQSSVTLYGEIDTSVQYLTHANAAGKSQFSMISAGLQPSLFGLLGSEDLGNGYKAIFKIEQGINSNDGSMFIPGLQFARAAYVGLTSNSLGMVTIGRQFSVLLDNTAIYDPTSFSSYSVFGDYFVPLETVWVNNAVKYRSASFGGFSGEALYSFGQQVAGDSRAGRVIEASVQYGIGNFAASATYSQTNGSNGPQVGTTSSGLKDARASVSGSYKISSVTLSGGYENISGPLQLTPRGYTYFVAVGYQMSPSIRFTGDIYHYHYSGSPASVTGYVSSAYYALSKRTLLYVNAGFINNRHGANFGLDPYTTTANGQSQLGVDIGLMHAF